MIGSEKIRSSAANGPEFPVHVVVTVRVVQVADTRATAEAGQGREEKVFSPDS